MSSGPLFKLRTNPSRKDRSTSSSWQLSDKFFATTHADERKHPPDEDTVPRIPKNSFRRCTPTQTPFRGLRQTAWRWPEARQPIATIWFLLLSLYLDLPFLICVFLTEHTESFSLPSDRRIRMKPAWGFFSTERRNSSARISSNRFCVRNLRARTRFVLRLNFFKSPFFAEMSRHIRYAPVRYLHIQKARQFRIFQNHWAFSKYM